MIRRFNRFELKYIIRNDERDAIRADLMKNMMPDSHGNNEGFYRVTSLYYDTPEVSCFWSKVEGIKFRRKVRIRIYGRHNESDDQLAMTEIKQRINRTVQKRRVALPLDQAYALCEGADSYIFEEPADRAVASEIQFLACSMHLKPACVISYLRQAWVGSRYEPGLRITFDEDLSCRGPEDGLGPKMPTHFFMPPDWLIMEVKADEAVPLWVTHMLSRHQCSLRRISKYCSGLALLRSLERSDELSRGESWTSC
ncbi:VTC domain-containing protein [Myxococcota bacterium]